MFVLKKLQFKRNFGSEDIVKNVGVKKMLFQKTREKIFGFQKIFGNLKSFGPKSFGKNFLRQKLRVHKNKMVIQKISES